MKLAVLLRFLVAPVLAGAVLSPVGAAEDFTEGMIARWTFNKPGEAALVDDVHGLVLEVRALPGASTQLEKSEAGTIAVGPSQFLVAPDINAAKFPELASGVTIWVRLRVDRVDSAHTAFPYGLFAKPRADWDDVALALVYRPQGMDPVGFTCFATMDDGVKFGHGSALPDATGKFLFTVLTFDGAAQSLSLAVDGEVITNKKPNARTLAAFENFSLGRVAAQGEVALTVDEIRIYAAPVAQDWAKEIIPVP